MTAQSTDTLAPVKVITKKQVDLSATVSPVQQLDKTALSKLNSLSVADAVKYFSGVVIKDYGGIGGLKTISVRSLGANHTGVMYDGMIIGDAQGGQIDLGRLSLDNIESIQLINNQPADILLPARSFASAAILSLSSFDAGRQQKKELLMKCRAGSFGFINPSIAFNNTVNKKFGYALNGEYQSAKGDYSFTDYETGGVKAKRENSDINTWRAEADVSWFINDSSRIKFKTYYYDSKRGLPGAIILFNNNSKQRLNNKSFFTQASWQVNISSKNRLLIGGKYSSDYKYYIDPSYPNSAGKLINEFKQQEIYFSAAYTYRLLPSLIAGYAIDFFKDDLQRTDSFALNFPVPSRNTLLNNIAIQFKQKYVEVDGNLLYTSTREKVKTGIAADPHDEFTPCVAVSAQPLRNFPFRIRASYKRIFRVPTFDDLYYTNIGNLNLRPEYANQYNLGFTFKTTMQHVLDNMLFTVDGYYNNITDRILATPRQNLFQWTMANIGKVVAKGIDAGVHFNFKKWKNIAVVLNLSYSYQDAKDVSDPSSSAYKTQLPYTPQHSGSINFSAGYKKLFFSYNILSSAYRYRQGVQNYENIVQGWATHDVSLGYNILSKRNWSYGLIAEANNMYNLQYEVIKFYPMPRFNYRLGITVNYKKLKI